MLERSKLITVYSWILIAIFGLLVMNQGIILLKPVDPQRLSNFQNKVSSLDPKPAEAAFVYESAIQHPRVLQLFFLLFGIAGLGGAVGLLKRHRWGRTLTVILMGGVVIVVILATLSQIRGNAILAEQIHGEIQEKYQDPKVVEENESKLYQHIDAVILKMILVRMALFSPYYGFAFVLYSKKYGQEFVTYKDTNAA